MRHVLMSRSADVHPTRKRPAWFLAATVLAGVVALVPASTGHATAPAPGLRLVTGLHQVTVDRFGTDAPDLFVPSAVWVTPTHGQAFEIDAVRAPRHIVLWQVDRSGGTARRIRRIVPPVPVQFATGLPAFFDLTLRNSAGRAVVHTQEPFCPVADLSAARIDGSGVDNPTFPFLCGTKMTRATVWGINTGWAVPVPTDLPASSTVAPDGSYTLAISIDQAYASQLHLDRAGVTSTVQVTVKTDANNGCPPKIICRVLARGSLARRIAVAEAAAAARPALAAAAATAGGLPDLVALHAHDVRVDRNPLDRHDYLDFAATIWNRGPGQFDIEGFRHTDAQRMTATQFIYEHGKPVRSAVIGKFEFDNRPGHHHWHLEDVARYDLLSVDGTRLVRSGKQSFCLAPTDPVNLTVPGALWQPDRIGLQSACPADQSIWLRESLPVGWGDTYLQSAAGQSFNISSVPNGYYLVRVTTDPHHRVLETNYDDNTSLLKIHLGGKPGHRTVRTIGPVYP